MNSHLCDWLDDFLINGLANQERSRFTAHWPDCPDCCQAISEHQRLKELVTEAVAQLELVPVGLTQRIEQDVRAHCLRRIMTAVGGLAASVGAFWLLGRNLPWPAPPQAPVEVVQSQPPAADAQPPAADAPAPVQRVVVSFPAAANVVAVPIKTESPNVTVMWVFPNRPEQGASAPDDEVPSSSPERSKS